VRDEREEENVSEMEGGRGLAAGGDVCDVLTCGLMRGEGVTTKATRWNRCYCDLVNSLSELTNGPSVLDLV